MSDWPVYVRRTMVDDFTVGDRVELHPATDLWMMGDRYGEVVKLGRRLVHVRLDATGRTVGLKPADITENWGPCGGS